MSFILSPAVLVICLLMLAAHFKQIKNTHTPND